MFGGKVLSYMAVGLLGSAMAAPVGFGAGQHAQLAHSPLGKLIGGNIGRLMVLRSELDVTDQQREQIRGVLVKHKPEIAKVAQAVWQERTALRNIVLDEKAAEADIRAAADELGQAIGDAAVLASKLAGEVRPVLTDEQREKIKQCRADCQDSVQKFFEKALEVE